MKPRTPKKCGQYFQADIAVCFKCGRPEGHTGTHGWASQKVVSDVRDVAAERRRVPARKKRR